MTDLQNKPTQEELPHSTLVLVFGIASIPCCCIVGGVFSIVFGILALVYHKKAMEIYLDDPDRYTKASRSNLTAGHVCGIIGLVLGALVFLIALTYILIWGAVLGNIFQVLEL